MPDAQQLPTTYRCNRRQARSWFAELRVFLTAHGLSQFDITTQHWATWRRYLAFHPRTREIIGNGVQNLARPPTNGTHREKILEIMELIPTA